MYLTNLADVARRTGFPVVEQPGWKTRGHGGVKGVRSIVLHHDAADHEPDEFNTVIQNGRSGLSGPLAQFALRRDGTIHVVAAGRAYHAGATTNDSVFGNDYSIGVEPGNNGVGEPWPRVQLDAYEALVAELCKEFGLDPDARVRGHKEVAYPIGRKPDPHGIDLNAFRSAVAHRMSGVVTPKPTRFLSEDDEMQYLATDNKRASQGVVVPTGATEMAFMVGFVNAHLGHVKFFDMNGKEMNADQRIANVIVKAGAGYRCDVPSGAVYVEVEYAIPGTSNHMGSSFRTDI